MSYLMNVVSAVGWFSGPIALVLVWHERRVRREKEKIRRNAEYIAQRSLEAQQYPISPPPAPPPTQVIRVGKPDLRLVNSRSRR